MAIYDAINVVSDLEDAFSAVNAEHGEITAKSAKNATRMKQATEELARCKHAKAEIERMAKASQDAVMTDDEMAKWQEMQAAAGVKLKELDTKIEAAIRIDADRRRIAEAAARRKQVADSISVVGDVIDYIAAKKQEIVAQSIDEPLRVANMLADGILKGPLVFEDGEIAMRLGSKCISNRVFSGTESAITAMGLTAGLATKSNLRVLILDEFGRLDRKNANRLVLNLQRMVAAKVIDQWFCIGPSSPELVADMSAICSNVIEIRANE